MATDLRAKLPYHRRLFLLLLCFSWALMACFVVFQYGREKKFKAETLNAQLQRLNIRLLDAINGGATPAAFTESHRDHFGGLRVTTISLLGEVLYDSSGDSLRRFNHLQRHEVTEAMTHGTGYTVERLSQTTDQRYFYSAMQGDSLVVRTAVPYSHSLTDVLAVDREFLGFMLGLTLLMSFAGHFVTHRLGENISRLRHFAAQARRGEEIDDSHPFPHDELGDISNDIIRLYTRLQKATADRDREHALALHEEQEKIRIKKQLTHNINHELKTPVAAIRGYLETLLANPGLDAEKRIYFLEKSCAQTDRLRRLLADISAITRMDEASHLILKEQVVLNDIIAELTADVQLLPAEQRMRVNCSFTAPVVVEGSSSLLCSVFRNLTDNATAYSCGRDIFIDLLDETETDYTLRFADNGIGIDEEHLSRIFERFYRIDTGRSRKMGGTGLGLSIVRNAVLLHGGIIEAHNRERGGLEFIFTLRKHSQR